MRHRAKGTSGERLAACDESSLIVFSVKSSARSLDKKFSIFEGACIHGTQRPSDGRNMMPELWIAETLN